MAGLLTFSFLFPVFPNISLFSDPLIETKPSWRLQQRILFGIFTRFPFHRIMTVCHPATPYHPQSYTIYSFHKIYLRQKKQAVGIFPHSLQL